MITEQLVAVIIGGSLGWMLAGYCVRMIFVGKLVVSRQLDDKDKQIIYWQKAFEKSEEQKAKLLEGSEAWIKMWRVIEQKAAEEEGAPQQPYRRVRSTE
jgi:hypothetical protein